MRKKSHISLARDIVRHTEEEILSESRTGYPLYCGLFHVST